MRLRRWEKETPSVGLHRTRQWHASGAHLRIGSARAAQDSLEDGARSPGRTRDTHPVTGGKECALSFIVPNSGRASLSRPRAQGSDRRCVWGTRRSGSCDVRRGRRRARRCGSVVYYARDFDSKTREMSPLRRATLNFEVVSSVRPIQMFRGPRIAAMSAKPLNEKKRKNPTARKGISKHGPEVVFRRGLFPIPSHEKIRGTFRAPRRSFGPSLARIRSSLSVRGGCAHPPRLAAARSHGRVLPRATRGTRRPRARL